MGNDQSKGGPFEALSPLTSSLDLSNQKLTTIPPQLKKLTELLILTINFNEIRDATLLHENKKLQELDFSHNQLEKLSDEFFTLKDLVRLNCGFNLLVEISPKISQLQHLVELNLSNNKITLITPLIAQLPHLTTLNLSFNDILSIPREIGGLISLTKLLLNNNRIREVADLGKLSNLVLLNLGENDIQALPKEFFSDLVSLTKLYLDYNNLLEIRPEISKLTHLKELNLRSNQLIDLPSSMSNLNHLALLDLDDNQWDNDAYKLASSDMQKFMLFLKQKKDSAPRSRSDTTSKEYRRTLNKQKFEELQKAKVDESAPSFMIVESKKSLYHLKGAHRILVHRVQPTIESLNKGDVFILDVGKKIYIWPGSKSNTREKNKAVHFAGLLNEEQGGNATLLLLNDDSKKADRKDFFALLGGKKSQVQGADDEDGSVIDEYIMMTKLFHFRENEDSRLDIDIVIGVDLYKGMLDSSSCSVLDCGGDIWIWVGTFSSTNERSWAMLKAEELMGHGRRGNFAEILFVLDGVETLYFKENFVDWVDMSWDMDYLKAQAKEDEIAKKEAELESLQKAKSSGQESIEEEFEEIDGEEEEDDNKRLSLQERMKAFDSESKSPQPKGSYNVQAEIDKERERERELAKEREKEKVKEKLKLRQLEKEKENLEKEKAKEPEIDLEKEEEKKKQEEREREREKAKEKEREKIRLRMMAAAGGSLSFGNKSFEKKIESEPSKVETTSPTHETKHPTSISKTDTQTHIKQETTTHHHHDATPTTPTAIATASNENESPSKEVKKDLGKPVESGSRQREGSIIMLGRQKLIEKEKVEKETLERQKLAELEKEKKWEKRKQQEKEKLEKERLEKERQEKEKLEKEKQEKEKLEKEKTEKEKLEKEKAVVEKDAVKEPLTNDKPDKSETHDPVGRPVTSGRRAPTKNPVRALKERAAKEEAEAKERKSNEPSSSNNASSGSNKPAPKNTQVGAFGLLNSLGADEYLFKKKADDREARKLAQASNVGAPTVDPTSRLIHVKGRRTCFVRQVENSYKSLNSGDVFILDCGKVANVLYQWNGVEANRIEKGKAMDIAKSIKDKERIGCRVILVDEGKEPDEFWKFLGGKGPIATATDAGDDREAELAIRQYVNLYKFVKDGEGLQLQKIEGQRLVKEMLDPQDIYLLDCVSEIYVWTGPNSDLKSRNKSLKMGQDIVNSREFWVAPLSRELPGSEQVLFKERFSNWGGSLPIAMQQVVVGKNTAKVQKQEKIDVLALHKPKTEKEEVYIDDGSGKVQVWRVEEFTKVEVAQEKHGQFFSGDSYLILYSYVFKNKECFLIYFWQGRNSSINEKGTSALLTIELDDLLKGQAKEVRVVQNKEPRHFLMLFKGKFIVHQGKDPLSKSTKSSGSFLGNSSAFYHIRGTNALNTTAINAKIASSTLNSFSVFALATSSTIFVWYGKSANEFERTFASNITKLPNTLTATINSSPTPNVVEIDEGKETAAFWNALGGKGAYPIANRSNRREPRLFQCSLGTGIFKVEEIFPFVQDDLQNDDVMILDAFESVFVWQGALSSEMERKLSMETAVEYVEKAPDNRPKNTPILLVKGGNEPFIFTTHFHGWDFAKSVSPPTFDGGLTPVSEILSLYSKKYTFKELVEKKYPKGLDGSKLEEYMEEDEFEHVFSMTLEEFAKFPLWKKQQIKRDLGLY